MSTSTWVALGAAILGGGAVGTVLTTFWRIKHERAEAWRSRLLDAADDFATGALEALMKLERVRLDGGVRRSALVPAPAQPLLLGVLATVVETASALIDAGAPKA